MLKKFLIGTVVALALLVGVTASAADFGSVTLRVGSKGEAVKAVQALVGATVDGSFGPMTAAKVKVWQAANGLVADGIFGKASMAKANGATVITPSKDSTSSTTLKGEDGDATLSHYSTSEKSKISEGDEDVKVLGFKVEADDSDIALNSVKVSIENTDSGSSYKITKYVDSVDIYKGSTKVGSADASDFSKDGDVYTKSISLKNAVVKDGDKDAFYVAFNAADSIDDSNSTFDLTVAITSYRFTDGSGVVTTDNPSGEVENGVTNDSSTDGLSLKSSSANPDDATIAVDEEDTTDDILALAFKLKADSDSSDVKINQLPISIVTTGAGSDADSIESIIESVNVKIDGDEYEADLDSGSSTASATYTVDLDDEDITVADGDSLEVKVYISFAEQDGNYSASSTTVTASVDADDIDAEDDDGDSIDVGSNTISGAELTLSTSSATLSSVSWTSASGTSAGTIDLFFTLEADNDDVTFTVADIDDDNTTTTDALIGHGTLSKVSGDASVSSGTWTVNEGDSAKFRLRYSVSSSDDGAEVKVETIAGQTVSDDKQLSPTVYLQ